MQLIRTMRSGDEALQKQDQSRRKALERARLAEELRANLQRRKAQARSRREGKADERPDGIEAATGDGKDGSRDLP